MEAQENSQTEQNVQTPKKRELALVSRSTYIKEKALQWIFFACAFLATKPATFVWIGCFAPSISGAVSTFHLGSQQIFGMLVTRRLKQMNACRCSTPVSTEQTCS